MPTAAEKAADEALEIALEFADQKLTLTEMAYHVSLEAHRIQGEQRARLIAGLAREPDADQVGRIARHLTVMKFLQNLHDKPGAAARHFDKIERERRNAG